MGLPFNLTINPSSVALALTPTSVSRFPGAASASTLSISRVAHAGAVALSVEGVPPGVTVQPNPVNGAGSSSSISVSVSPQAVPGTYPVTIRGAPAGWPPGITLTITLSVTVRTIPTGGGNVLLDWGGCAAPDWVAVSNGDGGWVRRFP